MTEEIWKDIPGYEGLYQVSNLGRVKSLPRTITQVSKSGRLHEHRLPGTILKGSIKQSGPLQVHIDGKNRPIHQLVLLAFVGPRPDGCEVCHNNSVPSDNRLENLRYDTRHSNRVDMIHVGNQARQKLSVTDAREIRSRLSSGYSCKSLATEYGVCYSTIWNVWKGVTFNCVEP